MEYKQQPNLFFSNNLTDGFEANQKKRSRNLCSPSSNVAQFQMMPTPSNTNQLVSTNLHLSYENNNTEEDVSSIINQQKVELDQHLSAQGEKLRRTLADAQAKNCRALMKAAEESSLKQIRGLDLEIDQAGRKTMELEARLARTQNQLLAWQMKVVSEQEKIVSLQAQIQQAKLVAVQKMPGRSEPELEDQCSVYEDPKKMEWGISNKACRVCGASDVSIVVLPCRHFCMCELCDIVFETIETETEHVSCPVCGIVRTGSIQVICS